MKYSLEIIWQQAEDDGYTERIDYSGYTALITYGCRITRDKKTKEICLFNVGTGRDYYLELTPKQVDVFLEKGWRDGCYELTLFNYRKRLKSIETMMRDEVNGRNNPKQIQSYKNSREGILKRYREVSNKLNKIK